MDRRTLDKLRRDLEDAWRSPQTADDLEALAKRCGRQPRSGKHYVWSSAFPAHRPVPIPRHGGNPGYTGHVRKTVLTALEGDIDAWEELVQLSERNGARNGGG
jgi:hypothetical protein